MQEWVRETMDHLKEEGQVRDWVAWVHKDHSNHDHAHVLAWSDRRWTREDLAEAREAATQEWEHTHYRDQDHELDLEREL
jgi:hypothetical protein